MKVWITRMSLTSGIYQYEIDQSQFKGHGADWHDTKEGAIARANQLKARKIISLEKELARIQALKFE